MRDGGKDVMAIRDLLIDNRGKFFRPKDIARKLGLNVSFVGGVLEALEYVSVKKKVVRGEVRYYVGGK